jgi:signal transduction histidine kinase
MSARVASPARGGGPARATDDELLDVFAAHTAHTLGAGVGVAGGYAALLRERHGAQLDVDGVAALSALEGGLGRLRLVVEDLLELSGIGASRVRWEPVDATPAVTAAAAALGESMRAASIEVEIAELPAVRADAALLARLLHHVIRAAAAAIGRGPGRIVVSGARRDGGVRLEVRDDGPPLAPGDAEQLFETFGAQRGGGPLAGAGVSLMICRRIAERLGGSVSARSGERGGATVVVVLPEAA